jgi:hypothetical protein
MEDCLLGSHNSECKAIRLAGICLTFTAVFPAKTFTVLFPTFAATRETVFELVMMSAFRCSDVELRRT